MPRCLAASAAAGDLCRLAELPVVELWTHAGLRWLQQLRADPFTFVILYAARLSVPEVLHEAARVDGTTKLQAFWHVTLPLLRPAILIAMPFRFIFAFRLFSEVWLLTQGGPIRSTEVVSVYLYLEAFRYNAFGLASATGWIMVAVCLLLTSVYLWRLRRDMQADV